MTRMKFMNTEIDNLTMEEALQRIDELVQEDKAAYVVTPNVDHLVQLEKGGQLNEVYRDADLILTDGKPMIWISHLYGNPIKEKVSGSDLFPRLCSLAATKGYRMYFLGAAPGVAAKAAENLTKKNPGLQVVGTYSPPLGFEKDADELKKIIRQIKEAKPHILIVALGCPKQELFIHKFKDMMNVPVSLGLGASIDFEAGNVKRAPKWMADHGLEWVDRCFQEPKRLPKRDFNHRKIFAMTLKYWKKS